MSLLQKLKLRKKKPKKSVFDNFYQELLNDPSPNQLLNIGAGSSFQHPYWTNVDLISDWYKNASNTAINYNLMSLEPLPITSRTVKIFYTSHVIEHVTNDAVLNIFKEAYRCLEDGGIFRITCPDSELAWRAIRNGDDYFYEKLHTPWFNRESTLEAHGMNKPYKDMSNIQKFITQTCSARCLHHTENPQIQCTDEELLSLVRDYDFEQAMDKLCSTNDYPEILEVQNRNFGFHMNWWNKAKVISFLEQAGFNNIVISAYAQSKTPLLRDTRFFDNTESSLSLYVEAYK